jgi:hypothetical protein
VKAHQRKVRDAEAKKDGRPVEKNLDGAVVRQISVAEATPFILRYEWLGTMPEVPRFCVGLFTVTNGLTSVVVFGNGGGSKSAHLCGAEHAHEAICLERGANAGWAPKNAGSFIISRACKLAYQAKGWQIFYAYADREAGEVGQIYQACNWHFIGVTGRGGGNTSRSEWLEPDGTVISSRTMRRQYGGAELARWAGLTARKVPDRSRYVWFEGNRKRWLKSLRYPTLPYIPANRTP